MMLFVTSVTAISFLGDAKFKGAGAAPFLDVRLLGLENETAESGGLAAEEIELLF
jgi:hypothetical protein